MSTALSRSGPTTGRPVLPPDGHRIGHRRRAGGVGGARRLLPPIALRPRRLHRLLPVRGGRPGLDPPFGSEGQAAVGQKPSGELWRGRPRNQQIYPTFPCRDGFVRICLLSARQWRGMRAWLGEPEQFADPEVRDDRAPATSPPTSSTPPSPSCSPRRRWTTWSPRGSAGASRSRRCSRPAEALASEHFRAVGALTETPSRRRGRR